MLCLCDPQDVISTAVKMSVRNKEQATNFAQVIKGSIQENPAQFEKRIKPWVYVRRITGSKAPFC